MRRGASHVVWLALALAIYFLINACMAFRVWLLLRDMKIRIPFMRALLANLSGMIASDFTPARSGYLTTAFVLSQNNKIPLEKSMVSILGPQIFDFGLKVTAGAIAFWYLINFAFAGGSVNSSAIKSAVIFAIFAISAMIGVIVLSLFSRTFYNCTHFVRRLPFGGKIHDLMEQMQKHSASIRRLFWTILGLLGLTWFLKALEWYAIGNAVGIHPNTPFHPLVFYAFLQPISTLLQFAPFPTLAGVGVFEIGVVFVLAQFGVPIEQAVVFALLTRFVMIAVDSIGVREAVKALKIF